jgi:dUTP pyrophosphatase
MTEHDFTKTPVYVLLTHEDAQLPQYAKEGDAGADVRAVARSSYPEKFITEARRARGKPGLTDEKGKPVSIEPGDYVLAPGATEVLDLGMKIQLQPGWEMQVRSRSGMAKRGLIVNNAPGTIDSGYRGPCMVLLHNQTKEYKVIKPGTRVAQFVLKRAPQAQYLEADVLSDSDRGEDGFGSTGTK